ncbi:FeoA family protein [Eubacteriaceae bacterium ES2]|nr:FeoA family protein [Eubacteriaceae bacterium ES2]
MMLLTMLQPGESNSIKKITGREATHKHLANLGFTIGAKITIISELNGSFIVDIRNSRVAIDKSMATHILV